MDSIIPLLQSSGTQPDSQTWQMMPVTHEHYQPWATPLWCHKSPEHSFTECSGKRDGAMIKQCRVVLLSTSHFPCLSLSGIPSAVVIGHEILKIAGHRFQ